MQGTGPACKLDLDAVLGKAAKLQNELIPKPPGCFISWPVKTQEAPGRKLLSVGGQHEKRAIGSMHTEVTSVKCARLRPQCYVCFSGNS